MDYALGRAAKSERQMTEARPLISLTLKPTDRLYYSYPLTGPNGPEMLKAAEKAAVDGALPL